MFAEWHLAAGGADSVRQDQVGGEFAFLERVNVKPYRKLFQMSDAEVIQPRRGGRWYAHTRPLNKSKGCVHLPPGWVGRGRFTQFSTIHEKKQILFQYPICLVRSPGTVARIQHFIGFKVRRTGCAWPTGYGSVKFHFIHFPNKFIQ